MSESKTASNDGSTVPSFTEEEVFLRVWSQFYSRAAMIVDEPSPSAAETSSSATLSKEEKQEEDDRRQRQAIGILNAITKILFGLDSKKKALSVPYGMGVLELSLALHKSACCTAEEQKEGEHLELDLATLKCIKCIVVRNPAGRLRCRVAGVFDWLENIFLCLLNNVETRAKKMSSSKDSEGDAIPEASIVEEALTTLAAMCLGDDLNALQGAVYLRHCVDQASDIFSLEKYAAMNQKITYLRALFDAMCKDEGELIELVKNEKCSATSSSFFRLVTEAEKAVYEAEWLSKQGNKKSNDTVMLVAKYDEADKAIAALMKDSNFPMKTGLLDPLRCRMHGGRAAARLSKDKGGPNEDDAVAALNDADLLLKLGSGGVNNGDDLTVAHHLRADALVLLGRTKEAQEAMAKVVAASPGDGELRAKFEKLST